MPNICECGKCGLEVKSGKRFIYCHHRIGRVGWNKGLTKDTDIRIKQQFLLQSRPRKTIPEEEKASWPNFCQCNCGEKCRRKFVSGHNASIANTGRKLVYSEDEKKTWKNICKCGCRQKCKNKFARGHDKRGIPTWNKGKNKTKNPELNFGGPKKGYIRTPESIAKGMIHSGQRRFSYISKAGITIKMRSGWETLYAEFLDFHGVIWQYESKGFLLSSGHRYYPDFYILATNEYHEVKGWMSPESQEKIDLFQKDYPGEKLVIIRDVPKYIKEKVSWERQHSYSKIG